MGGDGQRRVRLDGELALHDRRLANVPRSPGAARNPFGVAVVLRRSARGGLPPGHPGLDGPHAEGRHASRGLLRDRSRTSTGSGQWTGWRGDDAAVSRSLVGGGSRCARSGGGADEVRHRAEPALFGGRYVCGHCQRFAARRCHSGAPAEHLGADRRHAIFLSHAPAARRLQHRQVARPGHCPLQHDRRRGAWRVDGDGHSADCRVHHSPDRDGVTGVSYSWGSRRQPCTARTPLRTSCTSLPLASGSCWWRFRRCSG